MGMKLKPVSERVMWPFLVGLGVWILAIFAIGFSQTAYFTLTIAAIGLFLCQVLLNVRLRRE